MGTMRRYVCRCRCQTGRGTPRRHALAGMAGVMHTVQVLEQGLRMERGDLRQTVPRGAAHHWHQWNGPRFFGLRAKSTAVWGLVREG